MADTLGFKLFLLALNNLPKVSTNMHKWLTCLAIDYFAALLLPLSGVPVYSATTQSQQYFSVTWIIHVYYS